MPNWTSGAVTAALALTVACVPPNYEDVTDRSRPVRVVLDSEEVRRLISQQDAFAPNEQKEIDVYFQAILLLGQAVDREQTNEACRRYEEAKKNAEHYIPERVVFLDAMARAPAVQVAPNSYCRVLQRSQAKCTRDPEFTCEFVKVRITSGPSKGQEGWGCEGDGIFGAWPMP